METNSRPLISVIIGIRNRYDYRIRNALFSLRSQTIPSHRIEILLIDYGSDESLMASFNSLCREFNLYGVWTGVSSQWNRSHCLNIGLRKVAGDIVLLADSDLIFSENYIASCLSAMQIDSKFGIFSPMLDLGPGVVKEPITEASEIAALKAYATLRSTVRQNDRFPYGCSILCTSLSNIIAINGYDERYELWGYEDIDIITRLIANGMSLFALPSNCYHLHQWHVKYEGVSDSPEFKQKLIQNKDLFMSGPKPILDALNWGKLSPRNVK